MSHRDDTPLADPAVAEIRQQILERPLRPDYGLPETFDREPQCRGLTIVMLSYNRVECTLMALDALRRHTRIAYRLLLIDNASSSETRHVLVEYCAAHIDIDLRLLDENLGCGGGRMYAMTLVDTEFVLFLDNDLEAFPGSIEHLVALLERDPAAVAVTGNCIRPDGVVQYCGGDYTVTDGMVMLDFLGSGLRFDDPRVGVSGSCRWVSGGVTLYRTRYLRDHPYERALRGYFEDFEWSYRMNTTGEGRFYRCVESLFLHHHVEPWRNENLSVAEQHAIVMPWIDALAHFYRIHGTVLQSLIDLIPEFRLADTPDVIAVSRLLFDLLLTRGREWFLAEWNRGALDPLWRYPSYKQLAHGAAVHIEELTEDLHATRDRLSVAEAENRSLTSRVQYLESEIDAMTHSYAWRIGSGIMRVKDAIYPRRKKPPAR